MPTLLRAAVVVFVLLTTAHAQTPPFVASVVELEIAPAALEPFLAALRENAAASINEPACRRYDIMQAADNPNQVVIYEVYENEAAVKAHRTSEHFKKYIAATRGMVVKRQLRSMHGVASHSR